MTTNDEAILTWTFLQKCEAKPDLFNLLAEGEEILHCYKTVRDIAALTNKRLIVRDVQGITGKKVEIHSLPFRSIDMWSSENSGILDINSELELWTKVGHFKIKLNHKCDIREFDRILSKGILG